MGKKKAKNATTVAPASTPAVDPSKQLFASIVAATVAGGFIYATVEQLAAIPANYIEPNSGVVDPSNPNAIGVKATAEGIAWYNSQNGTTATQAAPQTAPVATASTPKHAFAVITAPGTVLPAPKRGFGEGGAKREETYPFSKLELGQFLVFPKSDDMPEPARSLASTVSSASRRFSHEVAGQTKTRMVKGVETQFPVREYDRKFEIRAVDDIGALGPQFIAYKGVSGAVVVRTK